jgi:Spy/CpxP family protein refolding chaperone
MENYMTRLKNAGMGLAVVLTAGLSACAPQQQATPPAAAAPSTTSTAATGSAPMDHQAMMAHCTEMRQQIRQGVQISPDMQRMATYCQHMDHTMGSQRGRSGNP